MLYLPVGSAIIEVNPYRYYQHRFWDMSFVTGVEYFSYNCGKQECSPNGNFGIPLVMDWPISYYPPATDNRCRDELQQNHENRDTNVKMVMSDMDVVLREAFGYLKWYPILRTSPWSWYTRSQKIDFN